MLTINATGILNFIIWILPLFPFGILMTYMRSLINRIENKVIPASEQDQVKSIVRAAVTAVEQTNPDLLGPQKRMEAVRIITHLLNEHGIQVSPVLLDTFIEQAVYLLKQGHDPTQTQVVQAVGQVMAGTAPVSLPK